MHRIKFDNNLYNNAFCLSIDNLLVYLYLYVYLNVSYSWPNRWTKLADIFEGTLEYPGGNIGLKNAIFFSSKI